MRYIKESFFSFGRKSEIYKKIVEYLSNNEIYTIQAGIGDKSLLDIFTGWVNFKFLKTDILMKYSDMYFLFSTKKIADLVSPDVSDIFHLYSIVVEKNRAKQIRYLSNINLHKWTGSFHEIDITISRVDMIFDLDLELKLITAWIGYSDLSLDRFIDWNELKNAVTREKQKSIPRIRSLEVKIGFKLPPLRKNDIEINFPDL